MTKIVILIIKSFGAQNKLYFRVEYISKTMCYKIYTNFMDNNYFTPLS